MKSLYHCLSSPASKAQCPAVAIRLRLTLFTAVAVQEKSSFSASLKNSLPTVRTGWAGWLASHGHRSPVDEPGREHAVWAGAGPSATTGPTGSDAITAGPVGSARSARARCSSPAVGAADVVMSFAAALAMRSGVQYSSARSASSSSLTLVERSAEGGFGSGAAAAGTARPATASSATSAIVRRRL
jgi:hypothetical protein